MTDDIAAFADVYVRYFQPEDGKMYQPFYVQWMQTQNNRGGVVHFENYIVNCRDYRAHVRKQAAIVWERWLDKRLLTDAVFGELMTSGGRKPIDAPVISRFVKTHALFAAKYTDTISRLYKIVNGEDIPAPQLAMYLGKLVDTDEYTLEALNEDILSNRSPHARATNLLSDIRDHWGAIHGQAASALDVERILDILSDSQKNLAALVAHAHAFNNHDNAKLIEAFGAAFSRDITVFEFLKYAPLSLARIRDGTIGTWLEEIKRRHEHDYATIKNMHLIFMDHPLSEIDYIKSYLSAVDDEAYPDHVTAKLLATETYAVKMRALISGVYCSLYRSELEEPDQQYMLECIRSRGIDLKSDAISQQVTALKGETDEYEAHMKAVYTAVLCRDPDALEWRGHLYAYRAASDPEATDALLREELYEGYEYHDILKQRIRKTFIELKNKDPLPSQQFALLKQALLSKDTARDPQKLAALIAGF